MNRNGGFSPCFPSVTLVLIELEAWVFFDGFPKVLNASVWRIGYKFKMFVHACYDEIDWNFEFEICRKETI